MYSIIFKTNSGCGAFMSTNFDEVEKKAYRLCKKKTEATIYKSGKEIGSVSYRDFSDTRTGWSVLITEKIQP